MAMALPDVIRVATGVVMMAFGAWVLSRRGSSPRAAATGAFLIAFGGLAAVSNIVNVGLDIDVRAFLSLLLALGSIASVAWLYRVEARTDRRTAIATALLGLAAAGAAAAGLMGGLATGPPLTPVRVANAFATVANAGLMSGYGLLAGLRARRVGAAEAHDLAALAAFMAVYPLIYPYAGTLGVDVVLRVAPIMLPSLIAVVAWAQARHGAAPRAATMVYLLMLAAPLAVLVVRTLGRDVGTVGITRVVLLGALAYGVFRWGALGLPERPARDRRAALTTAFLVTLLIVAQVAQNFLSAEYGLLMGGVVAGALLVAARPIERALDARHGTRAAHHADHERTYRLALRAALTDGALTAAEEEHLAELAEHLALPARTALRLRREVEEELGLRPRIG